MSSFPTVIDSTMLAAFRSCPQKFFRTYVEDWKPTVESVHLVAGKAFAAGLEAARRAFYEQNFSEHESIASGLMALLESYGDFECPPDSAKSCERTAGALEYYFSQFPLANATATPYVFTSGRRAIEFSFAEPFDVYHPVTGDPIIYCGRADMIADFAGSIYVVDEKTTKSLGSQWINQWEMRSQFTGYCWAAKRLGLDVAGVLVRGISILKTKYDRAEVPTNRAQWEIDRWIIQTQRDIERMKRCWSETVWDYNLDHACSEYGGCPYVTVCKSQEPYRWLPMYFEKRKWNPLTREETVL